MNSSQKTSLQEHFNRLAENRDTWAGRAGYYYDDLTRLLKFILPADANVLDIGCGTGTLLERLKPVKATGIDFSSAMIDRARAKLSQYHFFVMEAENLSLNERFDYIILSDVVGYFKDVQRVFSQLRKVSQPSTRIVITYQNLFWLPLLNLAEAFRLKMPTRRLNWLNLSDLANLLSLEGFEIIKTGRRLLVPKYIPIISWLANQYLAHLPLIGSLCLTQYLVARPMAQPSTYSVSVIVPARNEKGNIEGAVKRTPRMGKGTELIFIEGHSSDGTLEEIKRVAHQYRRQRKIRYAVQDGKGKGDAVRKGFAMATGDVLMILDADLTVPPEDLEKFYRAISSGVGEFINGSRLVYPMEKEAMRTLNLLGNRLFSIAFTWLLGQPIKDTLCGTKVILKRDYQQLARNRAYFTDFDPFGDFDLLFGASKLNLKIVEIPIRYAARSYGETNISRFKHGWLLAKMVVFALKKIKFI